MVISTSVEDGMRKRSEKMSERQEPSNKDNVYFNDPENVAEMARLLRQDRLITEGMGGLFPEGLDLSGMRRILDVACGPGGWALEIASKYPQIEVVGVDISRAMIGYARAQVQGLANASFRVMDIQQPLDFPDDSFDMVNARFINFLPAAAWPRLMREFGRITRSGGVVCLTESEWWYYTNSPALESLNAMVIGALKRQGDSFTQSGRFN